MTIARLACAAALATALAAPQGALAQEGGVSLWDYLAPDRIATRLLQMGVMSLRTQANVTYGTLAVSLAQGSATITDLRIRPTALPRPCEIGFDRVRLATVPLGDLDHFRLSLRLSGGSVTPSCFDPELESMLAIVTDQLRLSQANLDLDYRLSDASATGHLQLIADGLASVGADIDLAYLFVQARGMDDPQPVAQLNAASVTVENLGLWEKILPMLPPEVADPDGIATFVDSFAGEFAPLRAPRSPEAEAFVSSMNAALAAFVADPQRLILETGIAEPPLSLDPTTLEHAPDALFARLAPRMTTVAAGAAAILPVALLSRGYDDPRGLSPDEALAVGQALATGRGAPRDLTAALAVLEPAAQGGSAPAAALLATALTPSDPAAAYGFALQAAAGGVQGAAGRLDQLESELPFAQVLALQHDRSSGDENSIEALDSLVSIRSEALMRLSGAGRARSYERAAMWAMLGAAAGDSECAAILAEIDERITGADPEARDLWREQSAAAAELARAAWVGLDLPGRFGAQ